ncbi:MAG TPA: helix-turn-helix domain-containing protein [bacterium]|nr:helix-turn-helix domain-containing protein [bacterium]
MKLKRTKKKQRDFKKKEAIILYKKGFTTREIGKLLGYSHTWVYKIIKENNKLKN